MPIKKIASQTLGCKVNQQETDSILSLFISLGYEKIAFDTHADVYLINTCTVTHLGDRKSRQMIRRAVQKNPEAVVVVTGCYAQRNAKEIMEIPGVDIVIGTKERIKLPALVERVLDSRSHGKNNIINEVSDIMQANEFEEISLHSVQPGRVRAYLKIQEGCNQFCSYCIIPYTRGPVRSRSLDSILKEAQLLVEDGYKEIVLTGIHTAAYGVETPSGDDLGVLVSKVVKIEGLERLRISSIDPHEFGDKLLDAVVSNAKVSPHFHIPLQSGCDKTLIAMNRPYDIEFYCELLHRLRKTVSNVAISTDIMVGFPGETDEDFEKSIAFAEEMAFTNMHIFKYSPRSGTPAADFPDQVSPEKKEQRSKKLFALSKRLWRKYAEPYIGKVVIVLVEQTTIEDKWEGHTPEYLRVVFKAQDDVRGKIVNVIVTGIEDGYLTGDIL